MKIILNDDFGSFYIPAQIAEKLDCSQVYDCGEVSAEIRTNPDFIEYVETHKCYPLIIADIPDEATDYKILDYDGMETAIYVLDGKIKYT
jgi:hypothetical protein